MTFVIIFALVLNLLNVTCVNGSQKFNTLVIRIKGSQIALVPCMYGRHSSIQIFLTKKSPYIPQ